MIDNLRTAVASDFVFPSHQYQSTYLSCPSACLHEHIPSCTAQWTRSEAIDLFGESRFFHVTRDEGALLRFSLEARVVGEVFPEVLTVASDLRARIDALEGESSELLRRLRAARADHGWKEVLAS